jgi:hypothetical protein
VNDEVPPDRHSDEPEVLGEPALRADGTLEGRPQVTGGSATPEPTPEAPLELARQPPQQTFGAQTTSQPHPTPSGRWVPVFLIGLVLLGLGIAVTAMMLKPGSVPRVPAAALPQRLRDVLPEFSGPPIVITSEPPGATIRSSDAELGTTPWAGNNPFLIDTEVTVSLSGYQSRKVMLPGASEAHVNVHLLPTPSAPSLKESGR